MTIGSTTINPSLLALALGAFGIGVTEFAPMGMLPTIAADLGVSIPAAGLLVSAYAGGVLVGAPLMTLLFARTPRRTLLIGLMGLFTLGNLLSGLAGGYARCSRRGSSPPSTTAPSSASARSSRRGWWRRSGAPRRSPRCSQA